MGQPVSAATGNVEAVLAMLPPYCRYSQIWWQKLGMTNPEQREYWRQKIGPEFAHIHHYCNGLAQTNEALLKAHTKTKRESLLTISLNEFNYVINNSRDSFVLLPEILMRKGQNLIRLGRGPEAIETMNRAMRLKPDYWPPYAYLADYYIQIGEREKARELLKKGLSHAPGADALESRLKTLGEPHARR